MKHILLSRNELILIILMLFMLPLRMVAQSGIVLGPDISWIKATAVPGSKYDLNNGMEGWGPLLGYHIGYLWPVKINTFYNLSINPMIEIKGARTTPMALTYDDYGPGQGGRIGQVMYDVSRYTYFVVQMGLWRNINYLRFGLGIEPAIVLSEPVGVDHSKHFDMALSAGIAYRKNRWLGRLQYDYGLFDVLDNPFIDKAYQRGLRFSVYYRLFKSHE